MFPRLFSVRPKKRRSPSRANHRGIECLEDRILLYSTTGDVWTYGSRITYSFIPDGTSVGGIPLFHAKSMLTMWSYLSR